MSRTLDFYYELMNGIEYELEASTDNGATKELLFTSKVIETLSDGNNPLLNGIDGDVFRYAPTAFSYHINGYRINDDEKSITVYVTDFVDSQNLVFRNQREVESCMKGVQEFMKLCITDSKNILNQTMDYPIYEFVYQISHNYQDYNEINYVYITNASVREIKLPSFLFNHHKVNIILIDLERYRRFCDGKKILSIDADLNILESPIPFVSFCGINNDYDTYCLLFPGKVLFNFFDAYHYQLLNSNVRTYLQLKGSVNQGIMETIKNEPENFLAYNNGISAVATSVEIDNGCLVKVCDFQIVNGGQTSASIYNAVLKGYSVEKIRVQVKLTVIKNMTKRNEIIKCISRYANTQNAIKFSDFSSNDKYNKTLSDLSRSVCAPQIDSRLPKKWYYENVAGAYNIEKSDAGATFEKEYPKSQMFTKTDMAAYELSYQGFPAEACKGSQDAYKIFVQNLEYLDTPTISDFQHLIAKKILFDSTLKIINELGGQGKKAMACYVVAYMSTVVCDNKLNLDAIWRKQEISEDLESDLRALVYQICPSLRKEAAEIGRNVDMYCRMKQTWNSYKNRVFDVSDEKEYIGDVAIVPVLSTAILPAKVASILKIFTTDLWRDLQGHTNMISNETKAQKSYTLMCLTMSQKDLKDLSESQIAYALKIAYKFFQAGFSYPSTISLQLKEHENYLKHLLKTKQNSFSKSLYFGETS